MRATINKFNQGKFPRRGSNLLLNEQFSFDKYKIKIIQSRNVKQSEIELRLLPPNTSVLIDSHRAKNTTHRENTSETITNVHWWLFTGLIRSRSYH